VSSSDKICELGEGPIWRPLRKELFGFDILGKRVHSNDRVWQFDEYVSAAGWIDTDTLLIASNTALKTFNLETRNSEFVVALETDNSVTRSNDGRADPYGGFWIGTMGIGAEQNAGAIYRYYKGELRKLVTDVTISNSICFSPDGRHAYYTDTDTQLILKVSLDKNGWPAGAPEVHINLQGTPYRPDGAVMDTVGNLWSAQWGVGRIACYDPTGQFVTAFETGVPQTSCPAFGSEDMKTLYCTTAAVGRSGENDGKVFYFDTSYTGQTEHKVVL
jgi:sugar lactone lactonase YvrE